MPKRKISKGEVIIASPSHAFTDWFRAELNNFRDWNPGVCQWDRKQFVITYNTVITTITFAPRKIIVKSALPVVWLRQGLAINMGHGRIEVS